MRWLSLNLVGDAYTPHTLRPFFRTLPQCPLQHHLPHCVLVKLADMLSDIKQPCNLPEAAYPSQEPQRKREAQIIYTFFFFLNENHIKME